MGRERKETAFLEKVGSRLKKIREEKGFSQEYVYEHTKITLDRIENAKINYTLSTLYILCAFYRVKLEELFRDM